MRVLVTGVTGYIGGRLVEPLLDKGYQVSVFTRDKTRVEGMPWASKVENIIEGDLLDENGPWVNQVKDFDVIYYLVHSLYAGEDFDQLDRKCAKNFGQATQGVKHIIYLGGLVPRVEEISEHLRSREMTGKVLAQYAKITEFRAGPIIGSGSAPFEMVRYLTERVPFMVTPKWIGNEVQPIAVRDILSYLVDAAPMDPMGVVEVGSQAISFKGMMEGYAKARGLERKIYPLPVLTPKLSALWVGLVTPLPNSLAVALIEGIVHPVTVGINRAHDLFPHIKPIDYHEAVRLALVKMEDMVVETHWSRAVHDLEQDKLEDWEGLIKEQHIRYTNATVENAFAAIMDIGGEKGWRSMNWAWRIRGWIDRLIGGPGLARGRPANRNLIAGDVIDFWRVEKVTKNEELLLRAEMKVPGRAWLSFKVFPYEKGSMVVQTAFFDPHGLWGTLYWYIMYPAHLIIFPQMLKNTIKEAESRT